MAARRQLLLLVAAALVIADLAVKALDPVVEHPRSVGYVVVASAIAAGVALLVPRIPSRGLACAGAFAAAGAAANALSALLWSGGVPNPLDAGNIAFNLADVYAFGGAVALVAGAVVFALRNPALLREPI